MLTTTIEVGALVLTAVAFGVAAAMKRASLAWRKALPAIIATAISVEAFLAAYFWLFERAQCKTRADVACELNSNLGTMTLLGLVFAGLGVWTAALTHWAAERRARNDELEMTKQALIAATDEVSHNLIHIGSIWNERGWHAFFPQLSMGSVPDLLLPENRKHLDASLIGSADGMLRNWDSLKPFLPGPMSNSDGEPPPRFPEFVANSMRFLLVSLSYHNEWCVPELLTEPRYEELRRASTTTPFLAILSSDAADEAVDIRLRGATLVVWWDDQPISEVPTIALGPIFRDMAVGHYP